MKIIISIPINLWIVFVTGLWVSWLGDPFYPLMIYLKWQKKYYWCFYGILHQLLLMSHLAFSPISGSPMFSEAAACRETLHRPERGTWDDSVHMCHAGGHRQCTTVYQSASLPCPPTTGQQQLPKPKLYFPEMRQRQLKLYSQTQK